jgi:LuxR family maltose regulon positive regulatory protein
VIELRILRGLALARRGDAQEARADLERALTLAQPEGYARIFLDEGPPMQTLLAQWLAHADPGPLRAYATRLLSQFDAEPHRVPAREKEPPPVGGLVDPLSPRELEVLHLVALGHTNKEIAQQLFVAPGTVKAHTSSIYRKLDVANRTEAVARARQLGILP